MLSASCLCLATAFVSRPLQIWYCIGRYLLSHQGTIPTTPATAPARRLSSSASRSAKSRVMRAYPNVVWTRRFTAPFALSYAPDAPAPCMLP